jgi:hypothetical protein
MMFHNLICLQSLYQTITILVLDFSVICVGVEEVPIVMGCDAAYRVFDGGYNRRAPSTQLLSVTSQKNWCLTFISEWII